MTYIPHFSRAILERGKGRAARGAVLSEALRNILEDNGYQLGDSLRVPGAKAFHAVRDGKKVALALKISSDRWVSANRSKDGRFGALEAADTLAVITFDSRYDWDPQRLQVLTFDCKEVLKKAKARYKRDHSDIGFLPLDDDSAWPDSPFNLKDLGNRIYDEEIEWLDDAEGDVAEAGDESEKSEAMEAVDVETLTNRFKQDVARELGIDLSQVEITITLKI
ncbi:hypothetical protein ACFOYU_17175 [Microvirga sp. GCM10011540]|uniref:hypothetical protein n=1 Tax=Microvirga sp. GCM10011540 TaxID=3317338 RepID=UPI0036110359